MAFAGVHEWPRPSPTMEDEAWRMRPVMAPGFLASDPGPSRKGRGGGFMSRGGRRAGGCMPVSGEGCHIYSRTLIDKTTKEMAPELVQQWYQRCLEGERAMEMNQHNNPAAFLNGAAPVPSAYPPFGGRPFLHPHRNLAQPIMGPWFNGQPVPPLIMSAGHALTEEGRPTEALGEEMSEVSDNDDEEDSRGSDTSESDKEETELVGTILRGKRKEPPSDITDSSVSKLQAVDPSADESVGSDDTTSPQTRVAVESAACADVDPTVSSSLGLLRQLFKEKPPSSAESVPVVEVEVAPITESTSSLSSIYAQLDSNSSNGFIEEEVVRVEMVEEVKLCVPDSLSRHGRLSGSGKLGLVLDLDNTLLHALAQTKIGCEMKESDFLDKRGNPELYKFSLPSNRNNQYYLKLRPGLRELLETLAPYYEMSIYTNATKEYTNVVLKCIDSEGTLFGNRVVARDFESQREQKKEIEKIYPDTDYHCLGIFDDRTDVWGEALQQNIIRAEMYDFLETSKDDLVAHYAPAASNSSAPTGVAYAFDNFSGRMPFKPPTPYHKTGEKVVDVDRHLYYMTKTLLNVHKEYFENRGDFSVATLIRRLRSRVLAGVGLCLTGNFKNLNNNPLPPDHTQVDNGRLNHEKAVELGATVHSDPSAPEVTHVVAGNSKTDLFMRSKLYPHLKRVHTLWLWNASSTWEKPPDDVFDAEALCSYYKYATKLTPVKDNWAIRTGAEQEARVNVPLRSRFGDGNHPQPGAR
eukprot:GHVS01071803.1.p1 GENE.GHVS01071803.1~~GHVS01071803.1.p1  ORF type:complete len:749 (-),score=104.08 GHVS01071803.1:167-2413(-)